MIYSKSTGLFWRRSLAEEFTLHNRVGFKVTRLARIMETKLEKQLSEHGVTRLMWCVLRGVGMENVNSPSVLLTISALRVPAVSRLLRDMEKRGYIERNGWMKTRDIAISPLTPLGEEKMKTCHVLVRELNEHFAGKLDKDTYAIMMNAIDRMTEGEDVKLMRL